jgi:hypothetical protein
VNTIDKGPKATRRFKHSNKRKRKTVLIDLRIDVTMSLGVTFNASGAKISNLGVFNTF